MIYVIGLVKVVPPMEIAPEPPVIFNPVRVTVYVLLGVDRFIAYAALPAGKVRVEFVIAMLPIASAAVPYMAGTPVLPVMLMFAPVIVVVARCARNMHGLELLAVENVGLEIVPALLLFIYNVPPATLLAEVLPRVNVPKLILVDELILPRLNR
jgi:hypothetical protein